MRKGLLIDTNVLLVWVVGSFLPNLIKSFKRTASYTPTDYDLIYQLINNSQRIITTPGILAEVSNLSGQMKKNIREKFWTDFKTKLELFQEEYQPSMEIANEPAFKYIGLVDSGVISAARNGYLVLTDDARLNYELEKAGLSSLNLNYLRCL